MKTLITVLLASMLGTGFGIWRASSELSTNPHVVGEDVDLESLEIATQKVQAESNGESFENSGTISGLSLAKVETPDGTSLNFGTMKRGSEREHGFRFKNTGLGPLKLEVKGSTCKCTIGSLEKSVLGPNEETMVKLKWRAESNLKDFSQTATIGTNDPRKLEVQISIVGKIGQNYVVEPEELNFGDFSAREQLSRNFKLYSFEETPFVAYGYWADLDQKKIVVEKQIRKLEAGEVEEYADARYVADFKVDFLPGLPAGPINGQVRLEVGEERYPMSVRCIGKCVSDLRVVAGSNYDEKTNVFNAGKFKAAEGGERIVYIAARNFGDDKLNLRVKKIVPETVEGAFEVTIGEPKITPTQTLFPIHIRIPVGAREISRAGTSPTNYIKMFFETDKEPAGELSLYMKLVVEGEEEL